MSRYQLLLSSFFALLLLIAGNAAAHAQDDGGPQVDPAAMDAANATGWYRLNVDTSPNATGSSQSIGVSPFGKPYISYYDGTAKELRLATQVTPGAGNCGSNKGWSCTTVDSAGTTGAQNALAIHPGTGWPAIAYTGSDGTELKYAEATSCNELSCTWAITTVAQFFGSQKVSDVDMVFSGVDQHPHIAYSVSSDPGADQYANYNDLRYATYTGNGSGCKAGGWQCVVVDASERAVIGFAIGLNSSNRPQIVYARYNKPQNNSTMPTHLVRAAYTVNSGNCGPQLPNNNFTWTCTNLIDYADYTPLTIDLATYGGEPRIAYTQFAANTLNYMYLDLQDLNGNCGPANQWHCAVIDHVGGPGSVSIAMHVMTPIITYEDLDDAAKPTLKLATLADGVGNCGPNGGLFDLWQCTTLDNGNRGLGGVHEVGYDASIAWNNAHSYVQIAYADATTNDLLLIQEHTPAPLVSALSTPSIKAGSGPFTLKIDGFYFASDAWGIFDGTYAPTTRINANKIQISLDLPANTTPGVVQIRACNPPFPLTDCSNSLPLTIEKADNNGGGGGGIGQFAAYMYLPTVVKQ